jgi:hypothetical protein
VPHKIVGASTQPGAALLGSRLRHRTATGAPCASGTWPQAQQAKAMGGLPWAARNVVALGQRGAFLGILAPSARCPRVGAWPAPRTLAGLRSANSIRTAKVGKVEFARHPRPLPPHELSRRSGERSSSRLMGGLLRRKPTFSTSSATPRASRNLAPGATTGASDGAAISSLQRCRLRSTWYLLGGAYRHSFAMSHARAESGCHGHPRSGQA